MTCLDIETTVARMWSIRSHIIVPNVSWGLDIHECDLLIVTKSNYAIEVEIKISKSDLKKDTGKGHLHESSKIKYLYFAIPEKMISCINLIPEKAGIIVIKKRETKQYDWQSDYYGNIIRQPQRNIQARALTDSERFKLLRLGCMRIWGLKDKIVKLKRQHDDRPTI